MPKTPADADPQAWHRCFAMEANNRAWSLAVVLQTFALVPAPSQ